MVKKANIKKGGLVALAVMMVMTITSAFQIDLVHAAKAVNYGWPTKCHSVTGKWGLESGHAQKYHYGIDIGAARGAEVKAAEDGKVIKAGLYYGYGYCVIVKHDNGQCTLYGHNQKKLKVKKGERVRKGTVLAYVGGTGKNGREVYDPHCHFGIYKSQKALKKELNGAKASTITINPQKALKGKKTAVLSTKKTLHSHTISYSLNGGSGSFKSQTVKDGARIVLPTAKPTKAGYSFRGWYVKRSDNTWYALSAGWTSWDTITKKKYTPKTYTPGSSYTLDGSWTKGKANGSYTFYAQWAKNPTATLKFHPNGGTGSMPQKTIALNDGAMAFETLNQFRREGYTLNGWKVQKLHNGSEYWVVADGNGWKWKKDATVSERKLYRYTDAFTFRKGSAEAGDTIVVWASWKGAEKGSQTIEDGDYHIVSAVDPRYGLDVCGGSDRNETNVQVYQNTENDEQTFHVTYIGDGYYEIISNISGKSLDVAGAKVANRTNVQIYEQNGNDAQKWIIKDMGNGNYSIFSKCGGLCLDMAGARAANGTNVQMYQDDGSLEQKWRFVEVEDETSQDDVNADRDGDDIDQNEDTDDSDDLMQKENGQDPFEEGEKTETDLNNGQTDNQGNQEGETRNSTGQTDNNGTVSSETDPVIPAEEDVDPVYVWSDWSEYSTEPVEADENCEVETKTEYRYRDKQTVTSGRDALSGYTKESTSASSPVYGIWGANQQTASTNITDAKKTVVTVETKNAYKAYAWYCKCKKVCWHKKTATCKYCGKKTDYGKVTIYSEKPVTNYKKDTDGSYFLPTTVKVASSFGKLGQVYCIGWRGDKVQSFTTGSKVGNKNTFVWPDGRATVYRTKTVNYVNTFSKWGGWSGWSETQYNASGTRQVESRTLYRYRTLTAE